MLFLEPTDDLVSLACCPGRVIIGEFAPSPLDLASHLPPLALNDVIVDGVPPLGFRVSPDYFFGLPLPTVTFVVGSFAWPLELVVGTSTGVTAGLPLATPLRASTFFFLPFI